MNRSYTPGEMRGSTEMGPSGPLSLSYSQLSRYKSCPRSYQLMFLTPEVQPTVHGAGLAGSAVHAVIEAAEQEAIWRMPYDQHRDPGLAWMMERFKSEMDRRIEEAGGMGAITWGGRKSRDFPDGEDYQWWTRHAGSLFLRRYRTIRIEDDAQGVILHPTQGLAWVEKRVSMVLQTALGETLITGMVDALTYVSPEGLRVIRDWKTGSALGLDPLQLAVYSVLITSATQGEVEVHTGEFAWLRGTSKSTWLRRFDLTPLLPLVPRFFQEMAQGLSWGAFWMVPGRHCEWCLVRHACDYGVTLKGEEAEE